MKDVSIPVLAAVRARGLFRKEGQTLVEYALVLAVLSVFLLICSIMFTDVVKVLFSTVNTILDTAQTDTST